MFDPDISNESRRVECAALMSRAVALLLIVVRFMISSLSCCHFSSSCVCVSNLHKNKAQRFNDEN